MVKQCQISKGVWSAVLRMIYLSEYNNHMSSRKPQQGPLTGIRILDLTRLLPGPLATQMLADMGAEVIKIEDPKAPDYARFMPPQHGPLGVTYLALNRSKKSLCINLSSPEGKDIFHQLLQTADIVVESFRPGVLAKMGLDYESSKLVKEDIIYVSVTGYGQTGPYKSKAGHDINYLGYAGVLGISGSKEAPSKSGVQIADIAGGSYPAVIGCLSALLSRNATGKGQHVDVAMVDCALPFMSFYMAEALNTGKVYQREEHPLAGAVPNYNIYPCKDGKWVALGSLEPKFWMGFCALAGKPEWASRIMDPKLKSELKEFFQTKERDEWISMAAQADICLTPILNIDELETEPHHVARELFVEMEHPDYGKLKGINQPIKFSGTPSSVSWAPPMAGEDNADILLDLGFNAEEVAALEGKGIISR
jgi:crotonobetainyl-CoA:carnitine CoA-transferase CaiB-like acyl-CoA transferase